MKRITVSIALALALSAPAVRAQEAAGQHREAGNKEEGEGLELWAWLNFAILTGGLVWVFRKNAVPYFVSRAIGIRKGMIEADDARTAAEKKISAVEARLANLPSDIQALKDEAMAEEKSEHERVREETTAELAKIRAHAKQEIASAGKAARMDLKRYSARLAIAAAELKIRARMDPAAQDALVRSFVENLSQGPQAQRT
jgi:F-type H+-transporting ATPase subunit b